MNDIERKFEQALRVATQKGNINSEVLRHFLRADYL